jgi:polyisoprenyl-phosphate glycosyltransferase
VREARAGETRFKEWTAAGFYRLFRRIADVDIPVDVGDFRLVDRRALDAFKLMRENNRFVRGMFAWIGYRQTGVPYERSVRHAGDTKYPLRKMVKFAADGIVSFSNAPLRIVLKLGFLVSIGSFVFGISALVVRLLGLYSVPGLASLVVVTAFVGGVQLIVLGVIGEYIARIHDEVKNRPLYLVSELRGFDGGATD